MRTAEEQLEHERALARERSRRYRERHPEKAAERFRRWKAKNPGYWRKGQGLPEPTRPEPLECECCNEITAQGLHLDHDHETGEFRGWLCFGCNTALGKLGDNLEGVMRLVRYLRKTLTEGE